MQWSFSFSKDVLCGFKQNPRFDSMYWVPVFGAVATEGTGPPEEDFELRGKHTHSLM